MNVSALLTSAAINIGVCVLLLSLYSVLRKQPSNLSVYFGRRLHQALPRRHDPPRFERFIPTPSWILKAWETPEEEILAIGGLDAIVFLRIIIFSLRVFSVATFVCVFLVLPVNYYGQEMHHKQIPSESLEVFTIENVKEGSRWLWAHCLALYIITCSACLLLYVEYKNISTMRLEYIKASSPNLSQFTVLVRSIPWSEQKSYSDSVFAFFSKYHGNSYLGHQMVYWCGTIRKLVTDAQKICSGVSSEDFSNKCKHLLNCGFCGGSAKTFRVLSKESESVKDNVFYRDLDATIKEKEVPAAFVFFRTRFAACVAAETLQSSNPMLWVTDFAPEPHDIYWSNLCIPYRQIWIRKIVTLLTTAVLMFLFLIPVTFVQGLTHLEQLQQAFPFLKNILEKKFINQVVTGYLPSVILLLFLLAVPPIMMAFSSVEGSVSRSGRKKSACCKVLYFVIWNVFFVNVLSGSVISQISVFSSPKSIPTQLAKAVPTQASFFMTYIFTSGWAGLSIELIQPLPLIYNLITRHILRRKDEACNWSYSFPYHTEVPRVLLFGHLGFTFSILAPLMLPFLLCYFLFALLVYRNQILNVYITKYEGGGQIWPAVHNCTIFSLVLTQIIGLGVFGLKLSTVGAGFMIPLIILTLLFNEYCRKRFSPIFKNTAAQVLIDLDQEDERCGRLQEIHQQLPSAYCQLTVSSHEFRPAGYNTPTSRDSSQRNSSSTPGTSLGTVDPFVDSESQPHKLEREPYAKFSNLVNK
ncbi:hypothetical protein MLD38_024699 [Melastoma candidum]|uniref:Uncharacterized protein n=1 Tax=Melastoma candidum TaxID=119954 RepID=A0ACB9NW55_9MYRT|nr:hypothetical protein MLD38_024699 [Melastoma candidum]